MSSALLTTANSRYLAPSSSYNASPTPMYAAPTRVVSATSQASTRAASYRTSSPTTRTYAAAPTYASAPEVTYAAAASPSPAYYAASASTISYASAPDSYTSAPVAYASAPTVTYASGADAGVTYASNTYAAAPITYASSKAVYAAAPVTYAAAPEVSYAAAPVTYAAAPPALSAYTSASKIAPAKGNSIAHASDDKEGFIKFILAATSSKNTPEYDELYHFMLTVFVECDTDFDGRIHDGDFDIMVERAGALPRKWGFAPTSAEQFPDVAERNAFRKQQFALINTSGTGFIAFDEWLDWAYTHICEKARQLDVNQAQSKMTTNALDFRNFVINACNSRQSAEYKELYHFLQDCFTKADSDMDGKVGPGEFDEMIEIAADAPRKFGYAPPANQTYPDVASRIATRTQMFNDMDVDRSGFISFNEWLDFCYSHIIGKAQTL